MIDWLVWLLTLLATDPHVANVAPARAAAAVEVAYASMPRPEKPAGEKQDKCPTGNCPPRK